MVQNLENLDFTIEIQVSNSKGKNIFLSCSKFPLQDSVVQVMHYLGSTKTRKK